MPRRMFPFAVAFAWLAFWPSSAAVWKPVSFRAADGHLILASLYPSPKPRALIVYETVDAAQLRDAQWWTRQGFDVAYFRDRPWPELGLASGDARHSLYRKFALDWDAAIHWAAGQRLPIVIVGRGIGSAVGVAMIAHHPEVRAFAGFTSAELIDPVLRSEVLPALRSVRTPLYVSTTFDPSQISAEEAILEASPASIKVEHIGMLCGWPGRPEDIDMDMLDDTRWSDRSTHITCASYNRLKHSHPNMPTPDQESLLHFLDKALSEPVH